MPVAVLRAFHSTLGIHECYVADLDAIQGGAVQRTLLRELAAFHTGFSGSLIVDAGTHLPEGALEVLSCGASDVVVGLETLQAFSELRNLLRDLVGPPRLCVQPGPASGEPDRPSSPAGRPRCGPRSADPCRTSRRRRGRIAAGSGSGPGGHRMRRGPGIAGVLASAVPGTRVVGWRWRADPADLERMRDAGCDGALVASAIHERKGDLGRPGRGVPVRSVRNQRFVVRS